MAAVIVPSLRAIAKKARKRPFRNGQPVFRHRVTVLVDTFERSAQKVQETVQSALDEHTGTIQEDGVVEFEAATAIGTVRDGEA